MAGETKKVFHDSLNWKVLTIDAIKTILSIAIGSMVGYMTSSYSNAQAKEGRNQKMIVATVSNIENYKTNIETIRDDLKWIEESFYQLCSELEENPNPEVLADSALVMDFMGMYFQSPFPKQDTWIEENFITNGSFIRKTEVRLEIGSAYSIIDQCEREVKSLQKVALPEYDKYWANWMENESTAVLNAISDQAFYHYIVKVAETRELINEYLEVLSDLVDEIIENSKVDKEALASMRKTSGKVKDSMLKALGSE